MANYYYTDLSETPVSLRLTLMELKRLVDTLESLPEDNSHRFFASIKAREFAEMVRKAGEMMAGSAEDYSTFRKED